MTFFFLKHGATLTIKVMEERRYSFDLPQKGIGKPAAFICKLKNKELSDQVKEWVLPNERKKRMENSEIKGESK